MKIQDGSLKSYTDLKSKSPKNFYFALAANLARELISNKNNAGNIELPNLMGNSVRLTIPQSGSYTFVVNNKKIDVPSSKGFTFLSEAIQELFKYELTVEDFIHRPDDRTVYDDRKDFNKDYCKGTIFPSLYKLVKYSGEVENSAIKADVRKQNVFTTAAFKIAKSRKLLNEEDFVLYEADKVKFYYKKGTEVVDLTNAEVSFDGKNYEKLTPSIFNGLVKHTESYLDMIARSQVLEPLVRLTNSLKKVIVVYNENVYDCLFEMDEFIFKRKI